MTKQISLLEVNPPTKSNLAQAIHQKNLQGKTIEDTQYFEACYEIYIAERLDNWTKHLSFTKRAKNSLKALRSYYGSSQLALEAFRAALLHLKQENFFKNPNNRFSLDNLASNEKLITSSESYMTNPKPVEQTERERFLNALK